MQISPMKIHQAPLKVILLHVNHFDHCQCPQSGPQFEILLGTDNLLLTALGICICSLFSEHGPFPFHMEHQVNCQ